MKNLLLFLLLASSLFAEPLSYTLYDGKKLYRDAVVSYEAKEYAKAIENLDICVEYLPCTKLLAQMYANEEGVEKDVAKTVELYKKAIGKGDTKSLHNLANYYYKTHNVAEAKVYYKKAADAGIYESLYNLGKLYEQEKRMPDAMKCYDTASEHNVPQASYTMGVHYYRVGNLDLSRLYFDKAAKLGYVPAKDALKKLGSTQR